MFYRWSFDIDKIHLIGIDTEANLTRGSPQHRWIENDLSRVNRSDTPWVILGGHRPMYVDSYLDNFDADMVPVMDLMIKELEPLLWKYKVNLALWAHHHSYQRHSAVYRSTVVQKSTTYTFFSGDTPTTVQLYDNPQATVHMVLGTGGADFNFEDPGVSLKRPFPDGNPKRTWYPWSEVFFFRYGMTRVTALNETHLDITFKDSSSGKIHDHALITAYTNTDKSQQWILEDAVYADAGIILACINSVILSGITLYIFHSRASTLC